MKTIVVFFLHLFFPPFFMVRFDFPFLFSCCFFSRFLSPNSIDSELQVRVSDTALARDLFPQDYHCLGDNENRPVKWLSLEALIHKQFTPANDVVNGSVFDF